MSIPRCFPDLSSPPPRLPPPNLPNLANPPPNISNTKFYNGNMRGAGQFPSPNFSTGNNYHQSLGFPRMPNQNRPNYQQRFNQCAPRQPFYNRCNYDINRFMYPPHIVPGQIPAPAPAENFSGSQQMNMPPQENFPHGNNAHFQGQGHTPWRGSNPTNFRGGYVGFQGGRGGGRNQGFKKKKEMVDKRLLPENNVFFCDICDRGFKNAELYKQHTDGHIKCSYKDCPFIAAPKLVQLHMSMQHKTGLAKKVWSLESEEDVKKWREERKRCFPTLENVEKKKQELAEKIARGECINTKDFSKMKGGRNKGRERRGRGRGGRRGRWRNQEFSNSEYTVGQDKAGSDDDDDAPEEIQIKKSTLDSSLAESSFSSEVYQGGLSNQESSRHEEADLESKTKGLALLASYGESSSESEENEDFNTLGGKNVEVHLEKSSTVQVLNPDLLPNPFTPPTQAIGTTPTAPLKITNGDSKCIGTNESDSVKNDAPDSLQEKDVDTTATSGNTCHSNSQMTTSNPSEYICAEKADPSHRNTATEIKQKRNRGEGTDGRPSYKKMRRAAPHEYTLLEKLLAPEIRRERNKILQCVHYIIKHKFFHPSSPSCQQGMV